MTKMRVLQVGSGSMGTRRMRDVSARGDAEIALLETQEHFAKRAVDRFGVQWMTEEDAALAWNPEAIIISSPPATHAHYVQLALRHGLHFFCEAELFPYDFREIERVCQQKHIIAAPSCTEKFGPTFIKLQDIVKEQLGAVHTYTYTTSLHIRANRPIGTGKEYYAFNRHTNGTREIVPWALIALSGLFGMPTAANGFLRSGGEFFEGYEDTWSAQLKLDNGALGQLVFTGASPATYTRIAAVGTNGWIECDPAAGHIRRKLPALGIDDTLYCPPSGQVWETVYAKEIGAFMDAVRGKAAFPHDYRTACVLSGTLAAVERSALSGRVEPVDPTRLPALLPDQYEGDMP